MKIVYNVERLGAKDYDELLDCLNRAFGYPAERGFDKFLPVMWKRDDEHMGKHLAIRDGGRIVAALGVYPLKTHIAGKELLFATCGNVATDEAYRGKNCMRELMFAAMDELKRLGIDVARLGGQRQRYERYGFEPCGVKKTYKLIRKNFANDYRIDITFREIKREDTAALEFAQKLQSASPFYVDRGTADQFYEITCAWYKKPYLALDSDGKMLGMLSTSPDKTEVAEQYALDAQTELDILKAWMVANELDSLMFLSNPWQEGFARLAGAICESISLAPATHCKVLSPDKLCDALLALQGGFEGKFTLGIKEWGTLCFADGRCVRTDAAPELELDSLTATRLLFGLEEPSAICELPESKRALIRSVLPLPLGWNGQDRV